MDVLLKIELRVDAARSYRSIALEEAVEKKKHFKHFLLKIEQRGVAEGCTQRRSGLGFLEVRQPHSDEVGTKSLPT